MLAAMTYDVIVVGGGPTGFVTALGLAQAGVDVCLIEAEAGINDSPDDARKLAAVLGSRRMHVNLLRYNPTGLSLRGVVYTPSSDTVAEAFASQLRSHGLVAHFRRSRGKDIDAACGQLRRRHRESPSPHLGEESPATQRPGH